MITINHTIGKLCDFTPKQDVNAIIEAINNALALCYSVHWSNTGYIVTVDSLGRHIVTYAHNNDTTTLYYINDDGDVVFNYDTNKLFYIGGHRGL